MKFAQIGTFNVDNLGDLLFPIVLSKILDDVAGERNTIDYFSPYQENGNNLYNDAVDVIDLVKFDEYNISSDYDIVFIGGGDLIRSDDWSINKIYNQNQLSFTNILSPTSDRIDNLVSIGMGVPFDMNFNFGMFLKNSMFRYQGISVRDTNSQKKLSEIDVESVIIPDLVITISKYYSIELLKENFEKIQIILTNSFKLEERKYLIFQANDSVIKDHEIETISQLLNDISDDLMMPIVLLSIGECLGDNPLYLKLKPLLKNSILINKDQVSNLSLIDKVAILANSFGFIGSSLHGNIISYSYGIPHITFSGAYSNKLKGFFELTNNNMCYSYPEEILLHKSELIEYLTTEKMNNYEKLINLSNNVINFVKDNIFKKNNYKLNNKSNYSKEVDILYKSKHTEFVEKVHENDSLWERATNVEKKNIDYLKIIDVLWERIRESEEKNVHFLSTIDNLWERINDNEKKNTHFLSTINDLWERINDNEKKNAHYLSTIDDLWERINNDETIILKGKE